MSSFRFPSIVASLLLVSQACLTYCSSLPPGFLDTGLDDQLHNNTLTSRDIPHTKKRNLSTDEKKRLSDLSDSYKGIFWEVAYPGAGNEDGGCTARPLKSTFWNQQLRSIIRLRNLISWQRPPGWQFTLETLVGQTYGTKTHHSINSLSTVLNPQTVGSGQ